MADDRMEGADRWPVGRERRLTIRTDIVLLIVAIALLAGVLYQQDKLRTQNERQLEYWARQDQWNADFDEWVYHKGKPKAEFK